MKKTEKGQGPIDFMLWVVVIGLILYVGWKWIDSTLIPWIIMRINGLLAGDLYSWIWLIIIILVSYLIRRR